MPSVRTIAVKPSSAITIATTSSRPNSSILVSSAISTLDTSSGTPLGPHSAQFASAGLLRTPTPPFSSSPYPFCVHWHVPFKLILVVTLLIFTVAPSISLSQVSSRVWANGINRLHDLNENSTKALSLERYSAAIVGAQRVFVTLVERQESTSQFFAGYVILYTNLTGFGKVTRARPINPTQPFMNHAWPELKTLSRLASVVVVMANKLGSAVNQETFMYTRMGFNILSSQLDETFYLGRSSISVSTEYLQALYLVDYITGDTSKLVLGATGTGGASVGNYSKGFLGLNRTLNFSAPNRCEWNNVGLVFPYPSGLPCLQYVCHIPFDAAAIHLEWYQNTIPLGETLRTFLQGPKDRLFGCFANGPGTLIAVSHGQYYSHELNYSESNPLRNSSILKDMRWFSVVQATDPVIRSAGLWVQSRFNNWSVVPELTELVTLDGAAYLLLSRQISSKDGLKVHFFAIVDQSYLSTHEKALDSAINEVSNQNNQRLFIVLIPIVLGACFCAMTISYQLTHSLSLVTTGLHALAHGDFGRCTPTTRREGCVDETFSSFAEVAALQSSFILTHRGLKAFSKYIPASVVRSILAGDLGLNAPIERAVTILFMDIAEFSRLAENVPVDLLMTFMAQYLNRMCGIIATSGGEIDKFIGDCIMALWNAPVSMIEHESAACGAAFEMQAAMLDLNTHFVGTQLPAIRFRIGINTTTVLVGSFGCEHRIAFSCLGDGVNVASRLEATNKVFQTVVLVHERTKHVAEQHFLFREIGELQISQPSTPHPRRRSSVNYDRTEQFLTTQSLAPIPIFELLYPLALKSVLSSSFSASESPVLNPLGGLPPSRKVRNFSAALKSMRLGTPSKGNLTEACSAILVASEPVVFQWQLVEKQMITELNLCYSKGMCFLKAGDMSQAKRWFKEGLERVPEDGPSRMRLCALEKYSPSSSSTKQQFPCKELVPLYSIQLW